MSHYTSYDFDISRLGSFYTKDKTIFNVFAPNVNEMFLVIDGIRYTMNKNNMTYELSLSGDYEYSRYYFENELGDKYKDPFSYLSDNEYSYVLDVNKFNQEIVEVEEINDYVIYECNVRDFSCNEYFDKPRSFLALSQSGLKLHDYYMLGLDYIVNLGVSHIQLMPVLAYDLDGGDYNWGYNPLAYNYVYKDYVYDKDNLYAYINELRHVVNILHSKNIRVNLDVVFNHVYKKEIYDLDKLIGNCFRFKNDGSYADGTYCGNEIKSEDVFMSKYIVEMVKRYIKLFDIDGLRLDLMGILDYKTVYLINSEAKKMKPDFLVYGEGWNMGDVLKENKRASIINAKKIKDVSMFNDYFRDTIINYVSGNESIIEDVKNVLSCKTYLSYKQSINYVECHDNYTFFDRMIKYKYSDPLWVNINRCKLAMALVMVARGKAFIHMGQEFLRTKQLIDNSYNASEDINKIDWHRRVEYNHIYDYLKDLITIRKENKVFIKDDVNISFEEYFSCLIYKIDDYMIIINNSNNNYNYQDNNEHEVIFDINGKCKYINNLISIPAYSMIISRKVLYN